MFSHKALGLAAAFLLATLAFAAPAAGQTGPRAVPTFECMGLYWSPQGGAADRPCQVRYRPAGEEAWREGFPLWFDDRDHEYRGSLVNLRPGTTYEIALALGGNSPRASLTARTWSENFPVGKTVVLPTRSDKTLKIDRSGTPNGYTVYTRANGSTATIDVAGREENGVEIDASYVILRGITIKNAGTNGIRLLKNAHDVVIEECDISGWGRVLEDGWGKDYDAAVYAKETSLARVVIQRNRMHHPRSNANNWTQYRPRPGKREPYHPEGPQAVVFWNSAGNHVIRYNDVWSDDDHQYNDCLGAGSNFSREGFPNRDSDIYGNRLSHCWDDAIESEGANANVRIWGNYIADAYVAIACAGTSVGPLYIWRNASGVMRRSLAEPSGKTSQAGFLKTSDKMGGGKIFLFHNTVLQPQAPDGRSETLGCYAGIGWGGPISNVTSRNNVLNVRGRPINEKHSPPPSDYDYDLYSGWAKPPAGQEQHGVRANPVYAGLVLPSSGQDAAKGQFQLAPNSPGYDAGLVIPNFNDGYQGRRPDLGAHEAKSPPMEFGADAYRSRK